MRRLGLSQSLSPQPNEALAEHEWWLPDLATYLAMPRPTLYNWVRRGWVCARQQPNSPRHWIIWADETELNRLKAYRQQPDGEILKQRWRGETPAIANPPKR